MKGHSKPLKLRRNWSLIIRFFVSYDTRWRVEAYPCVGKQLDRAMCVCVYNQYSSKSNIYIYIYIYIYMCVCVCVCVKRFC